MKKLNKIWILGLSILCVAMLLISCANEPKNEWTDITSLKGLEGTWTGKDTLDYAELMGGVEGVSPELMGQFDGMEIDYEITLVYPIMQDGEKYVKNELIMGYEKYLTKTIEDMNGFFTIDEYWDFMKNSLETEGSVCSDGSPYTITTKVFVTEAEFEESIDGETSRLQVNQDKTKIKSISVDEKTGTSMEFILYKK